MLVNRWASTTIFLYSKTNRGTSLVTYNDAFNDELRGDKPPLLGDAMRERHCVRPLRDECE